MLRRLKTLPQRRELLVAHLGFSAKARNQRVLAVLRLTQVAELGLPGVRLGVQPPELCVLLVGLLAHNTQGTLGPTPIACLSGIVSHPAPRVHAQPRGAQHRVARSELSFPFWITDVRRAGSVVWLAVHPAATVDGYIASPLASTISAAEGQPRRGVIRALNCPTALPAPSVASTTGRQSPSAGDLPCAPVRLGARRA